MNAKVKLEKKPYMRVVSATETNPAERVKDLKMIQNGQKMIMPAQPVKYIKARTHDCL